MHCPLDRQTGDITIRPPLPQYCAINLVKIKVCLNGCPPTDTMFNITVSVVFGYVWDTTKVTTTVQTSKTTLKFCQLQTKLRRAVNSELPDVEHYQGQSESSDRMQIVQACRQCMAILGRSALLTIHWHCDCH